MNPKCYSYIRFSTIEQRRGDSLRRQTKLAHDWAEQHGMVLDESTSLQDLGRSAFSGDHLTRGALGGFLKLVKKGMIAPGSVLLIENLDRLSRQKISEALGLFLSIIEAGIKIVTLADNGREYSKETVDGNVSELMISLVSMARANEESTTKSRRVGAAWSNKRDQIGKNKKKLTGMAPYWLELSKDKTEFFVIPARAAIVERIYRMKLDGIGYRKMEKILNQEPDTWSLKSGHGNLRNGWQKSYIETILSSRAVIGEYQPKRFIKDISGKTSKHKEPAGDPISDYFPRIISDELFFAVRKLAEANRGKGGRDGKFNNLFGHIAKCGYCGAPMQFVNKSKGIKYLLCDNGRRGRGCATLHVRYGVLEQLILNHCKHLALSDILPDGDKTGEELRAAHFLFDGLQGKRADLERKTANTLASISTTADKRVRERLEGFLAGLLDETEEAENQIKSVKLELDRLSVQGQDIETRLSSVKELLTLITEGKDNPESSEYRRRLRNRLRQLIKRIDLYPIGRHLMTPEKVREQLKAVLDVQPELVGTDQLQELEKELAGQIGNRELACFTVHYEGGSFQKFNLYRTPHLVMDFDREQKSFVNRFLNRAGETEEFIIEK